MLLYDVVYCKQAHTGFDAGAVAGEVGDEDGGQLFPGDADAGVRNPDMGIVVFYEGIDGAEVILRDILVSMEDRDDKEYYVYSHSEITSNLYDKFKDYTQQRIAKGIRVKTISFDNGGTLSGLDERKWFETDSERLTYTLVYSGKVAFIARDHSGNLSSVLVENDDIYKTQKSIFLSLWKTLPSIK